MSTQRYHDPQDVSLDNHRHTEREAPPYRRWSYETKCDERRVSPDPKPLGRERIGRINKGDNGEETRSKPRQQRLYEAKNDSYDHHFGRSRAATKFHPQEAATHKQHLFDLLKGWNDGTRDSDRQVWEGKADKLKWTESHGQRLSLPYVVIEMAKRHLIDLGDIRRLGNYNGLHRAVVASLTRAYQGFWHLRRYREIGFGNPKPWRERDDFRKLWESVGFTESELRKAARLIGRKTNVTWPRESQW